MVKEAPRDKTFPGTVWPLIWTCAAGCLLVILCTLNPVFGGQDKILLGFQRDKESESIPQGWVVIPYPRTAKNKISLFTEGERTVLHVKSLGSASALLKTPEVDVRKFPILVWRWKINRVVGMAIESQKDRNDSAARIRVIFATKGEKPRPIPPEMEEFFKSLGIEKTVMEPRGDKIDYIWGNRLPVGETLDFPRSQNHKVVVVESGKARANRWIWEKRNLIEDYELLFEAAPPDLAGIVILTDTDQTNEGVEAWYSSIVLMSQ
jgi:hypothetical protein